MQVIDVFTATKHCTAVSGLVFLLELYQH